MKAGSTSGTFHDIVKPNPSVTLVAAAGVLAESGMASGSGYTIVRWYRRDHRRSVTAQSTEYRVHTCTCKCMYNSYADLQLTTRTRDTHGVHTESSYCVYTVHT